jgi:MYXO-CTERM domain-containing protein
VTSEASAVAWHFDLGKVVVKPALEVSGLAEGPALRARPMVVKPKGGPAQYLLDALPNEVPADADAGAGAGAAGGGAGGAGAADVDGGGDNADPGASDLGGCHTSTGDAGAPGGLFAPAALALLALRRRFQRGPGILPR